MWRTVLTDVHINIWVENRFATFLFLVYVIFYCHWYFLALNDNKKMPRQGITSLVCVSCVCRRLIRLIVMWLIHGISIFSKDALIDYCDVFLFIPLLSCYTSLWIVTLWFGFILLLSPSLQLNMVDSQHVVWSSRCFVLFVSCEDDSNRILNGIISCTYPLA